MSSKSGGREEKRGRGRRREGRERRGGGAFGLLRGRHGPLTRCIFRFWTCHDIVVVFRTAKWGGGGEGRGERE